jgi:hypothetical protein
MYHQHHQINKLYLCDGCADHAGVTKTKKDVQDLVKSLNIQFDNLCQVRQHRLRGHRLSSTDALLTTNCSAQAVQL